MRASRRERGEGQLGCVIGLIIMVAAIFIAYKLVPVKFAAADLRRTIIDEARSAGSSQDARIRRAIMTKAEDLGLPLEDKDLEIIRRRDTITIEAEYVVPVEFPGYTFHWKQRHKAENPLF
jgi:hypothetical protein